MKIFEYIRLFKFPWIKRPEEVEEFDMQPSQDRYVWHEAYGYRSMRGKEMGLLGKVEKLHASTLFMNRTPVIHDALNLYQYIRRRKEVSADSFDSMVSAANRAYRCTTELSRRGL